MAAKSTGVQRQASIKPELSKAEVEEMSEWFTFFDKNNDGHLDKDELKRVFHAMSWSVSDEEADRVFKSTDTDDNGFIDRDEYMSLLQTFRKDPYTEKLELIEAFRHLNRDKSGTIDAKILKNFLLVRDMALEVVLDNIIVKADHHGNGILDIEEFVDLMLEKPTICSSRSSISSKH